MTHITCEMCGANLDFGERCDCTDIDAAKVPNSECVRLGAAFRRAAERAFSDPQVQAEYETWRRQMQEGGQATE